MQELFLTLKNSKISQIPQIGLRLINKLHNKTPSKQFWSDYIHYINQNHVYSKFSPHSKCLLTCVVSKFDDGLMKSTNADTLIRRIFNDLSDERSLCTLNLELINMLFVSSYTLRIPLSNEQLILILKNIKVDDSILFNIEHCVSILHSLGKMSQVFPKFTPILSTSSIVEYLSNNYNRYSMKLNCRELSLTIFAFDKLKVIDERIRDIILNAVKSRVEEFDGKILATILYTCSQNRILTDILLLLRDVAIKYVDVYTGREMCNIACAYLKADLWENVFLTPVANKLSSMNTLEVCNILNLIINKNIKVDDEFKCKCYQYLKTVDNVNLLDLLTIAQAMYKWEFADAGIHLDRLVDRMMNDGKYQLNDKLIYLLYYCSELQSFNAVLKILNILPEDYISLKLNNREIIILYTVVSKFDGFKQLLALVEGRIMQEISQGNERFSRIDLITIVKIGKVELLSLIIDNFDKGCEVNDGNLEILSYIARVGKYPKLKEILKRWCSELSVIVATNGLYDHVKGDSIISLLSIMRRMNTSCEDMQRVVQMVIDGLEIQLTLESSLELLRVIASFTLYIKGLDNFIKSIVSRYINDMAADYKLLDQFITASAQLTFNRLVDYQVVQGSIIELLEVYTGDQLIIDGKTIYMLMESVVTPSMKFLRYLSGFIQYGDTNRLEDYQADEMYNKIQSSVYSTLKNLSFNPRLEAKTTLGYTIDVLLI